MMASWPCPTPDGGTASEHAFSCEGSGPVLLLIVPALFDEGNRLRRFTAQTMHALALRGIGSVLIDLPGTNESLQPLGRMTLSGWQEAVACAARHFSPSHVAALRGGAMLTGAAGIPTLSYAPTGGATILRQMIRMRVLSAREAGREEKAEDLLAEGREAGIVLGGYALNAAMVAELEHAGPAPAATISHGDIGGGALWLRAEPGEDAGQADALAARLADGCSA